MDTTEYKIDEEWQDENGFRIYFKGIIKLNNIVTEGIDDEWRQNFYNFTTDQEIAEHIAYNMVVNDATLSRLDGFADLPDDYAVLKVK